MNKEYLITFHTHYEALVCMRTFEKTELVQNQSIVIKLIPVPREVSSSCGTAVKLKFENDLSFDNKYFDKIEYDEIFKLNENGKFEKVKW